MVVEINAPKEIPLGKPFDLAVKYDNASASVLRGAKIYLNLPEGAVFLGESEDKRTEERSVGDIGVGASAEEVFRLLILKDPKALSVSTLLSVIRKRLGRVLKKILFGFGGCRTGDCF